MSHLLFYPLPTLCNVYWAGGHSPLAFYREVSRMCTLGSVWLSGIESKGFKMNFCKILVVLTIGDTLINLKLGFEKKNSKGAFC